MRRPVVVPRRGELVLARLRLRRREVLWWATAIGLAATTVIVLAGTAGREGSSDDWGPPRSVLLAGRPLEVGDPIVAEDVTVADWPAALVPADAVTRAAEGRVPVATIGEGEVLVERRLAPEGLRGAVALLPPGARAVAVPAGAGGLALRPGDRVDVLATLDPFALDPTGADRGPSATTVTVATGATVVATGDGSTTVAVPAGQVGDVASALGQGVVTLALVSPLDVEGDDPG